MPALRINDIDLAYETYGAGKPLLMLHAAHLSRRMWQRQVYPLSTKYQVITLDLRGHGQSGRMAGVSYSTQLLTNDVSMFLAQLNIERAIVCGHGLGSMVAQELAITYPDQVSALILAEATFGMAASLSETAKAMFNWWKMSIVPFAKTQANALANITNADLRAYLEHELSLHGKDKDNYLNIWRAMLSFSSKARLRYIDAPTLLLFGDADASQPARRREIRQLERGIKKSTLKTISKAGYYAFWEQFEAFNKHIVAYLEDIQRPVTL
jgi:non-heme chloroperoxidase